MYIYRIHFSFRRVKLLRFPRISSHPRWFHPVKNLDQSGNELRFEEDCITKCKNGGDSLGQLDMQLRTCTKAIDYINTTRIQRKERINTMEAPCGKSLLLLLFSVTVQDIALRLRRKSEETQRIVCGT